MSWLTYAPTQHQPNKPPLLPSGHTHQNFFMHDEHIRLCKKKEKKGIRFKVGSDENIPTVACF
jgi:hypothetical protein